MIKIRNTDINVGRDMEPLKCSCTMFKNSKGSTHFGKDSGNFKLNKCTFMIHSSNYTFREFIQERGKYVTIQNVDLLIHSNIT